MKCSASFQESFIFSFILVVLKSFSVKPVEFGLKEKTMASGSQSETKDDSNASSQETEKYYVIMIEAFKRLEEKPFTYHEDQLILKYILKDFNLFRVSSPKFWKELELKKRKPKRSWETLRDRFFTHIKPKIFCAFRHLLKDEITIEKIFIKFPELSETENV